MRWRLGKGGGRVEVKFSNQVRGVGRVVVVADREKVVVAKVA